MTSVSPLPSYMSGYLHQLGGQASGVYRSASDYKHKPFEHWQLETQILFQLCIPSKTGGDQAAPAPLSWQCDAHSRSHQAQTCS